MVEHRNPQWHGLRAEGGVAGRYLPQPASPRMAEDPDAAVGAVLAAMATTLGPSRIHIIDDDESAGRALTRVLRHAGFHQVELSTDPLQGATRCEERQVDLVFLDLQMPGCDGMEVLGRLRSEGSVCADTPIVMLTGDDDLRQRRRALARGATDFILKPFNPMEVLLRAKGLLEKQELHRRLLEQNRTLEARVAERTQALEASQLDVLKRLAAAAEFHDDVTGQHTQRVGRLSGRLAERLGHSRSLVGLIAQAAPLHDLGKIAVPDSIVQKPGRLTPEEYGVMKTHVEVGAQILSGGHTELMQMAERIARYHHERWDGTGYPAGLAGTAIPIEARIVGAADFFDALTHDRPYREAVSLRETIQMIDVRRGTHFDPAVATTLLQLVDHHAVEER